MYDNFVELFFNADAQTKSTTPSSTSKLDRNAAAKAKLQRNLERSASTRYNPHSSQRAFGDAMKDPSKDVFVINGYELQFNSYKPIQGNQPLASISLFASGEKFGEVMFFGGDDAVQMVKQKMGKRETLENGEPVMLAYHMDMLPNILTFLESSRSVAVVLDQKTQTLSLSSGQVSMWERR